MKNKTICENCKSENDIYRLSCVNCGALLRDKYPNIDLFSTIWQIIETPITALKKIIYAEHKNYLFFLLILLIIKLTFTSFFVQSVIVKPIDYQNYLDVNFGIGFAVFFVVLLLFPLLQKTILKSAKVNTRYKDNLALIVFTQMPLILFLLIVLPIQFALFGKFWLFSNPSPFIIKETAAYVFSVMELLTFIWSFFLFGVANFIQSNSKLFSFLFTLFYIFCLAIFLFFIPYLN